MKVKKQNLLLIAGIVWAIAGANILRIGIQAYAEYLVFYNFLISAAVFAAFYFLIFGRMVKKHTKLILGYEEPRQFFLKFFDVKSFIIMAFMITLGITLRATNIAPDIFIAVFYTGLGSALLMAGICFAVNFFKSARIN